MYPNLLRKRVALTPDRIAFEMNGTSYSWSEVYKEVERIAQQLPGKSGDRVGFWAKNSESMYFYILAALLKEFEIVFFNDRLTQEEFLFQQLDSEVVWTVTDQKERALLEHVFLYETILGDRFENLDQQDMWAANRTISIMYTSGTTGRPKGVRQTLENHMTSALGSALNLGILPEDKWLCVMPLYHISGFSMIMRSLIYGSALELHDRFRPESVMRAIQTRGITHLSVVTTMLQQLLEIVENEQQPLPSTFRVALAGGGPVPIPYLEKAQLYGFPVIQTYGMTETSSQTCTLGAEDAIRKAGSAGRPLFFADVRIDGENEGEIWVRGSHVTPGYIGMASTQQSTTEDGWFKTGDIGRIDEEGYLYILDRRSDLIVSGGENIYPAEVEQALLAHPDIVDAGVVAMDDAKWGQVPVAFVQVKEGCEPDLKTFLSTRLASYKQPVHYYFVDALPRNASNKLVRRELKDRLL
ncbi:o-succinylbenzoate--CoA ligase [Chryseomicrobium palamuruense]